MKKELKEEMFDAMLRSAFHDHAATMEPELETEAELRAQGIEPHVFSTEFEREMKKLVKKTQRKTWRTGHRKGFQRAAAMFALVILTGSVLVTQVDAVRVPVMSFVISAHEKFSEIQVVDPGDTLELSEASNDYLPSYVPEGFFVEFVEEDKNTWIVQYSDGMGGYYSIDFYRSVVGSSMDTENATIKEKIINGYPALIIEKEGILTVDWCPDGNEYIISGTIPLEEICFILNSIEKFS